MENLKSRCHTCTEISDKIICDRCHELYKTLAFNRLGITKEQLHFNEFGKFES